MAAADGKNKVVQYPPAAGSMNDLRMKLHPPEFSAPISNGRRGRASGLGLMALFLPMAASGYLLQVAVDPEWRRRWIVIHIVSSLLWVAAFVVHQVRALRSKAADQSGTEVSAFAITANQSTDSLPSVSSASGGRQTSRSISSGTSPATIADSTSAASGGGK